MPSRGAAFGCSWSGTELQLPSSDACICRYRAQIEADIKPFEGILLGVFFMTAGANLDPGLVLREWPTLATGILAFIGTKVGAFDGHRLPMVASDCHSLPALPHLQAGILFVAGEFALGLSRADAARVALLLSGGGEFAFVVFKLAEDLGVLPETLAKLLTASVLHSGPWAVRDCP